MGAHGGSSLSSLGGAIRLGELVRDVYVIPHALKVALRTPTMCYAASNQGHPTELDRKDGYRWPATTTDGLYKQRGHYNYYGGKVKACQMGSLLALDPSWTNAKIKKQFRTEPGQILARTMRDYGAYICDSSAWNNYKFCFGWGPDGNAAEEFQRTWGYPVKTAAKKTPTSPPANDFGHDMELLFEALSVVDNNGPNTIGGGPTNDPSTRRRRPHAAPCAPVS